VCHWGEKEPEQDPSIAQSRWVIKGKKNEPLYLHGAGQESSANVIKILSSPLKDTYRSSSAKLFLSEKENQLNRWGLSFPSSCERNQGCLLLVPKQCRAWELPTWQVGLFGPFGFWHCVQRGPFPHCRDYVRGNGSSCML
jgi:hypothetical protein